MFSLILVSYLARQAVSRVDFWLFIIARWLRNSFIYSLLVGSCVFSLKSIFIIAEGGTLLTVIFKLHPGGFPGAAPLCVYAELKAPSGWSN